jgi:glutamate dehydrogenase/leucine dehydrogenase
MTFDHEQLIVQRGSRSGLPVAIAVHSTALGMAIGGCRMRHYPDWRDAVADAMRLAESMTYKSAVAGLDHGGGKTVVALPGTGRLDPATRRAVLLDVGDAVESLGGRYGTGPDVGTGPPDMVTIAERTRHVFCRPAEHGGSGDSSGPTAEGVLAALAALCAYRYGTPDFAGRRFTLIGLGHVGAHLAKALAAAGADLLVTDVDPGKRAPAEALGAAWVAPADAPTTPTDVLIPAAMGGLLTTDLVPLLRCTAVAGPANNQLAEDGVAGLLHERGILWLPDPVVSAGGAIYGTAVELRGRTPDQALTEVRAIGKTVTHLLTAPDAPHVTAHRLAAGRLKR